MKGTGDGFSREVEKALEPRRNIGFGLGIAALIVLGLVRDNVDWFVISKATDGYIALLMAWLGNQVVSRVK